jgi:outer membrane protein OmpA-like peptidoglycan-associated protein
VSLGIEEARLTSKGFGDTKPISDNITPEGKANNRRVEFVRTDK